VPTAVVALVALLGVALGLLGSIFGPYYGLVAGALIAGAGALMRRRSAFGLLLLAFGIGVAVGSLAYVALGLLQQGASGSGSGSSLG
jgi:hypothetical protein